MNDEIIIKNEYRVALIVLCLFGLIVTFSLSIVVYVSFEKSLPTLKDALGFISLGGVALFCLWQIISLLRQKNYLETSDDGIMLHGAIKRYIPWENVKNILVDKASLISASGSKDFAYNKSIRDEQKEHTFIYIELHDPDRVFFDSHIHKFTAVGEHILNEKYTECGNKIPINTTLMTTLSQEAMCSLLRERWLHAIKNNPNYMP